MSAPAAQAQTPTVTLTVPAMTEFAEGEGQTTVTVTATLSAARLVDTVVDLTLAGTARTTDYAVVGTLPDITITPGQTTGTADVTLNPVDDVFFEGDETISIGGTATNVTIIAVHVPLADNDDAPEFELQAWHVHQREPLHRFIIHGGATYSEGDSLVIDLEILLKGGTTFEEDITVAAAIETNVSGGATADDLDFGTGGSTRNIEIPAGAASGQAEISFSIVDDDAEEPPERFNLTAKVSVAGMNLADDINLFIGTSDQPIGFIIDCPGQNEPLYPGVTTTRSCKLVQVVRPARPVPKKYTVTYTESSRNPVGIDPDSFSFMIDTGMTESALQSISWMPETPSGKTRQAVTYTAEISPSDMTASAPAHSLIVFPSADPNFEIDTVVVPGFVPGTHRIGTRVLVANFHFPRPARITGQPKWRSFSTAD